MVGYYIILICNIKYILHKFIINKSLESLRNVYVFQLQSRQFVLFARDYARDGAYKKFILVSR